MKAGKSEVVCEQGKLIKLNKDKEGVITREVLTKIWTDWVNYWAVDFDYESRREIIKVAKNLGVEGALPGMATTGEFIDFEERWTGAYIFENEWQSFRTRQSRNLELTSANHPCPKAGRYTIAVKVIDIFGNDTMTLVPVTVGDCRTPADDFVLTVRPRWVVYALNAPPVKLLPVRTLTISDMPNLSELKATLLEALAEKSVRRGSFTLASGAQSDLYVDSKLTTLDPRCALLIGKIGWELIKRTAAEKNLRIDSVGGLTVGADPIAQHIALAAHLENSANEPRAFIVRKDQKKHGLRKMVEGNFSPGDTVVVVDDVITKGGSTIEAIEKIEAEGGKVAFAVVLVDRQEQNGRQNIEDRGVPVISIFNRQEVLAADATKSPHPAAA